MSDQAIRWESWTLAEESDRRFRRVLAWLALPALLFSIALPYLQISGLKRGGGEVEGKRYVELMEAPPAPLAEKEEEPAPAPQEEKPKPEKAKRETKPLPTKEAPPQISQEQRVQQARAKAAKALAWTNEIAGLSASDRAVPNNSAPLLKASPGANADSKQSSVIAAAAAATSGGIGDTGVVQRGESGTGVGTRRTTKVEAPKGFSPDPKRAGQGGDKLVAGRTIEEVNLMFDKNKAGFLAIYQRALRQDPGLSGKLVLSLTIAPDGSVSDCKLVGSSGADPDFEKRIIARVKMLNFGARKVPPITFSNYPIFLL